MPFMSHRQMAFFHCSALSGAFESNYIKTMFKKIHLRCKQLLNIAVETSEKNNSSNGKFRREPVSAHGYIFIRNVEMLCIFYLVIPLHPLYKTKAACLLPTIAGKHKEFGRTQIQCSMKQAV